MMGYALIAGCLAMYAFCGVVAGAINYRYFYDEKEHASPYNRDSLELGSVLVAAFWPAVVCTLGVYGFFRSGVLVADRIIESRANRRMPTAKVVSDE